MKKREEIEEKFKWDLTKFCKSNDDFYKRLNKLKNKIKTISTFEGKLENDEELFNCLECETALSKEFGFLYLYANLCKKTDNANTVANEMCEKINSLQTTFAVATTFIDVEVSKLSDEKLKTLQKEKKFKDYKRYFEGILRHKKHILPKNEENLLSHLGEFTDGFSENFDVFSDVDLKFGDILDSKGKKHALNQSNYTLFAESEDRTLRKNAFKRMNGKFGEFINFLSNNYINEVKELCVFSKLRKYPSALAGSIYNEEASEKVYKLLIKKVRENVKIMEDFFDIKRQMLNLDTVAVYDTFAPIVKDVDKKFTFDEAIELIKNAVQVLGGDYVKLIDRAVNERWIDVYPNENKDSGAFSWGCYGATPVVLTNFEGNLSSVFTLAHELGHAMHSFLSDKNQPYQTAGYVIFVAEVASTTNEMLLLNYLLARAKTKEEKMFYYNHFLVDVRSTIFRQTMFSEFEEFVHAEYEKGVPLTRELLCKKYQELNNFYHGKSVEQIDEMQFEWARIPHFYSHFYVYKYATGLICAVNIANKLVNHDENQKEKYLKFLSSGSIKSPIALLKSCGCDLEKEEIYDDVFAVCKDFIRKWKALL